MKGSSGLPAAFFDLAMGALFVLLAIVLISTVEDPKKSSAETIQPKAEFLVTMDWDDNSPDDIDLYVRSPDGKIVFFSNRQTPVMFLDADNLGHGNTLTMPDGSVVTVPTRREVVTIRAIVPGIWTINSHFYRKASPAGTVDHCLVTLTKLNPYAELAQVPYEMDTQTQERTIESFVVEPDGRVSSQYADNVKLVGVPQ